MALDFIVNHRNRSRAPFFGVDPGNHQDVPVQPEQRHHRGVPQEDEADPAQGLRFQELRELQVEGQGVMRLIWHWILLSNIGIGSCAPFFGVDPWSVDQINSRTDKLVQQAIKLFKL